jgi:hypothetical protein
LLLAPTICSRKFSGTGEPSFIIALSVAGIAYLLAIRELLSTPNSRTASSSSGSPWLLCGMFYSYGCHRVLDAQ